eukprot:933874_1
MKTFLQRICTLAVCVTVVQHSSPVGVLGSEGEAGALQEKVKRALETLEAMEEELQSRLVGLKMTTETTREPVKAELQNVQDITSTLEALRVANATLKDSKAKLTEATKANRLKISNLETEKTQLDTKISNLETASVWKNRGGGFLAGTIFGGVGTLAGKYLLDDLNADAPTGSEDAGEGEISQDDLTISSGAVGVSSTM